MLKVNKKTAESGFPLFLLYTVKRFRQELLKNQIGRFQNHEQSY